MQIKYVALGVVISEVERDRANSDVHLIHEYGFSK
jgi:hypothetical protein